VKEQNNIVLHACCAICSGYPRTLLKSMGYSVTVYFCNPNIFPQEEYEKRLNAQKTLCKALDCKLVEAQYNPKEFYDYVKGFEDEPEKGLRCDKCFELRLRKTAEFAKQNGIKEFTTSIVISPHKNFTKLKEIGEKIAQEYGLKYLAIDFKKQDGFLKTNKISKELNLYRQNYCGCEFSLR
jgi:predicted adenine nucleotide alpha hydrolase (AANH) superfamily ATPase